jgi:hypothetical protein
MAIPRGAWDPSCVPNESKEGAWSVPAEGLRARILASMSHTFYGTPQIRIDLELQNVSDVATPIEIEWDIDALLSFELADETGRSVPRAVRPCNITRVMPYWIAIPCDSTLRTNITTSGYGQFPNQRWFLGLPGGGAWESALGDTHRYSLLGTLSARSLDNPTHRAWRGTITLPAVELP